MTDRTAWFRIRREMFEQLMEEVSTRWGREPLEIRRARTAYDQETSKTWKASAREELLRAFQRHSITLIGDFHALQQSQKAQRRLLDLFVGEDLGLAVECLPASAQKVLDRYLSGDIDEKDFLKKSRWSQVWGFPWEHYRPLFEWARRNRVPMLALNHSGSKLRERDRFAAKLVADALAREPERRWVVLYGDLHLRAEALPRELEKKGLPRPLRIFQNVESASFRLLKKGLEDKVDVIRYDRHSFAVLSVPPWVKWQNYLLWLDQTLDRDIDDDEGGDVTDSVAKMIKWLAAELQIEVSAAELSVYTAGDPDVWSRIKKSAGTRERVWIETMIEDGRSFYLSRAGWGYLARPSVNHAASLAMQFLHDRVSGGSSLGFQFPGDFPRMIWIEAVAYFGSKIVNPSRKSDTLLDIRSSLSSRQGNDRGKEALRLALSQKMMEMMSHQTSSFGVTPLRPKHKSSWIAAAHLLGALAGERLYNGYRKRLIRSETIGALLAKPLRHEGFDLIYHELLEMIESLPAPFRSKKDKL